MIRSPERIQNNERISVKRLIVGATALALSASIMSAATSEAAPKCHTVKQHRTINHNKIKALQEIAREKSAKAMAKSISDAENSSLEFPYPSAPNAVVLNGIITQKVNDGKIIGAEIDNNYVSEIVNAYFLEPSGSNLKHGDETSFLDGAWIGIATNDAQGKVLISPIKFDAMTMNFKENTKVGNGPLIKVGIYLTRGSGIINGKESTNVLIPMAYDLNSTGNILSPISNDDGTIFAPGEYLPFTLNK